MATVARLLISLCAGVVATSPLAAQSKPKSSSNVITAEEIDRAGSSVGNGFDVVQLLRPHWLRVREPMGVPDASGRQMPEIRVYLDERDQGDVEYLKTIPASRIESLRFMSMTEAGARFGPSAGPGIVVTLRH